MKLFNLIMKEKMNKYSLQLLSKLKMLEDMSFYAIKDTYHKQQINEQLRKLYFEILFASLDDTDLSLFLEKGIASLDSSGDLCCFVNYASHALYEALPENMRLIKDYFSDGEEELLHYNDQEIRDAYRASLK